MIRAGLIMFLFTAAIWPAALSAAASPIDNIEAPETIILGSLRGRYQQVTFDHALHDDYASCVECHHHVTGKPPSNPACIACHRQGTTSGQVGCRSCHFENQLTTDSHVLQDSTTRYHIDIPGLVGAYHLRCVNCHLAITAGPSGCLGCHKKRENGSTP